MDKCIEIHIPGVTDESGLYFEGVSKSNLFEIISELTSGTSDTNGKNLETLNEILNNLEQIKKTSKALTGKDLDSSNIGDNVIGNASIMDISRILFRNEVEGSELLLPMFNLLQSTGFNTSSSNIILTTDKKVKNGIHLGSKYFKIILNPTQPNFVAQLHRALGFAYIDQKIKNKGAIGNIIETYLDEVARTVTGIDYFDNKIQEIIKLDDNQKLRAFVAFISDKTNIPKVLKTKIDFLNKLIEADIATHLQENIEQTKEWIKYGKDQYKKDAELVNSKTSDLREQEHTLLNQQYAQYYYVDYQKDKDLIAEHRGKKKLSEEIKTQIAEARKRVASIESKLNNPEKSGFVTVEFDPSVDYAKEVENLKNTIAGIKDLSVKIQIYDNKLKKLTSGWNPYLVDIKTDQLENILNPDLQFEVVEPRFITIGNKNISLKAIRDFLKGYANQSIVQGAPEATELIKILEDDNIVVQKDSIPFRGAQRQFLKDNLELFKLLWDAKNYPQIDAAPFDLRTIVNRLILENTLYMPYEDYKSNLMFDLTGLSIQYNDKSFENPSPISRINEFRDKDKYLSVKFTPQRTAQLRTKNDELIVPMNEEIKALPPEVETYLKTNLTNELYLDFGDNSNINAEKAADYLRDVVALINNTEDVYRITRMTIKGLNNLQVNVAKAIAAMGISVRIMDTNETKFQEAFDGYNVKSFSNDVAYKFPDTGSQNLEKALINNEVSGIFYDLSQKTQSEAWKLSKVQVGNPINLGFRSGNTFRGIIKNIVQFNPSKLVIEKHNDVIDIGSKVQIHQKDSRGRNKILGGNFYVVDVIGSKDGNEYLISNGFQTFTLESNQTLVFDKQFPYIKRDGITMFPVEETNTLLEARNGNIHPMPEDVFQMFYDDEIHEIRRITGLSKAFTDFHITSRTAHNIGVVEITPIEKIDVNANPDEGINKADTESIVSIFAGKLNTIFGNKFVEIIDETDTRFTDGETHHPAFIRDGKIYININHPAIHPGSLVHELSHLILGAIKVSTPDAYYNVLESIDLNDKKYDNYKIKYKNRSRSDIQEEICADMFSRYFDHELLDYGSLEKAFNNMSLKSIFVQLFDITGGVPDVLSNFQLMNMTINDAVNKTASGFSMKKNLFDNERLYQERKLSNYKEELIKNKNLKEECL